MAPKHRLHEIKSGTPIHLFMKMKPTDLEKFEHGVHVTILATKRTMPANAKRPKKTKK